MRISDWSSDVCSSDLGAAPAASGAAAATAPAAPPGRAAARAGRRRAGRGSAWHRLGQRRVEPQQRRLRRLVGAVEVAGPAERAADVAQAVALRLQAAGVENGRASCRARGGRDGWISGGPGSKKTK